MSNYWISLLLVLLICSCKVQNLPIKDSEVTSVGMGHLERDLFGNLYVLTEKTIVKLNSELDTLSKYTFPSVDQISKVDILNPNEIAVFSENAQEIYILDNALTEITRISLSDTELGYVKSMCRTRDDFINVISRDHKKIFRIDNRGIIQNQSEVIWAMNIDEIEAFIKLDNTIAMYSDKEDRVLLYDEFGTFITQILNIQSEHKIRELGTNLYYMNDANVLIFKDIHNPLSVDKKMSVPPILGETIFDYLIFDDVILYLDTNGVQSIKIKRS